MARKAAVGLPWEQHEDDSWHVEGGGPQHGMVYKIEPGAWYWEAMHEHGGHERGEAKTFAAAKRRVAEELWKYRRAIGERRGANPKRASLSEAQLTIMRTALGGDAKRLHSRLHTDRTAELTRAIRDGDFDQADELISEIVVELEFSLQMATHIESTLYTLLLGMGKWA